MEAPGQDCAPAHSSWPSGSLPHPLELAICSPSCWSEVPTPLEAGTLCEGHLGTWRLGHLGLAEAGASLGVEDSEKLGVCSGNRGSGCLPKHELSLLAEGLAKGWGWTDAPTPAPWRWAGLCWSPEL